MVTKLKNSDGTKLKKKTQMMTKLKISNCHKTQKTHIVTKPKKKM